MLPGITASVSLRLILHDHRVGYCSGPNNEVQLHFKPADFLLVRRRDLLGARYAAGFSCRRLKQLGDGIEQRPLPMANLHRMDVELLRKR